MIVPMCKVFIVARQTDRDQVLATLQELGTVHLIPVDPAQAVPDEAVGRHIETAKQALQILSAVKPEGAVPDVAPIEAAREVHEIRKRTAEGRNRLASLYYQLEQIAVWDGLRLEQIEALRQAGIEVQFFAVPANAVDRIHAECVAEVGKLPNGQAIVAVATRTGEIDSPKEASPLRLPANDAQMIRAEAKQIDESIHKDSRRLHELAQLVPAMEAELSRLEQVVDETVALRSGMSDDDLIAFQGWMPEENVAVFEEQVGRENIPVVLETMAPAEDETPPTLVRPPAWARPIEGLFGLLGTVPGYREFDVSVPFLIALPIFTAMLISDGGYGALILLGPLLAYRRVSKMVGARFTQLLMLVGAVSVVWGFLTNTFFGFPLLPVTLIPIELSDASRLFMMRVSFVIGAVHLSLAQLWQAVRYYPNLRMLNRLGWALFVWGMYGVVNMFVLQGDMTWATPWPYLLILGAALAIVFASPSRNPVVMVGMGLAQFPLSMLSTFSDVISYVRLMAVGLASSVLAISFNKMALDLEFWPLMVMVLVFGHGLNIGLALIAMFAHGVRLNMLEFSNNLGMEWTGYPYRPFARRTQNNTIQTK